MQLFFILRFPPCSFTPSLVPLILYKEKMKAGIIFGLGEDEVDGGLGRGRIER